MNKIMKMIVVAAITYAVKRFFAQSRSQPRQRKHRVESWENEGGALAPQLAPVETSQVPR